MPDNTLLFECPTVPTIVGSEMRFSISTGEIKPIFNWPLNYVSCREITPPQYRFQWGLPTFGPRLDSYSGLRLNLGSQDTYLDYGYRSTNATGTFDKAENQRVGVASLTIDGKYKLQYWNDHSFPWWPVGDGGDKGDTAGFSMSYNLGNQGFPMSNGWNFSQIRLSLRMATGVPDYGSAVTMGGTTVYTNVEFEDIDRGDINLNALFSNTRQQRLDVGITVNSGAVRNYIQSKVVHKNLDIPEFEKTHKMEFMMYFRLSNW
jgi:hypothetical protein